MATLNRYLTYYIVLTDPALVQQYQAQFPNGYQYAPYNPLDASTGQPGGAAVAFAAPWAGSSPGAVAPYTYSPEWISANNYDQSVASFERHSGGFWGFGGTTVRYYWLGIFKLAEPATPTVAHIPPVSPQPPPARRFVEGFEFGAAGVYFNTDAGGHYSRDAARHVGGMGLALRGPSNNASLVNQDGFGAALKPRTWERVYIRLRQADPSQTVIFWGTHNSAVPGEGVQLGITPDGRLALYSTDVASARTLIATSTAVLPTWNGSSTDSGWQKLDILVRYNPNEAGPPVINTGRCQVYLNGASVIAMSGIPGLATAGNHKSSFLGTPQVGTALYLDLDDWMCAEWPGPAETASGPALTGPDWLLGTKIVAARPKALGTNHANWTGDLRVLMQNPLAATANAQTLTSTTSGAIAEVDLDVDLCVAKDDGAKGVLSFMVHAFTTKAAGLAGSLGYLLNGAAAVMTAIAEGPALTAFAVVKSLADGAAAMPPYLTTTTLSARKTKGADGNGGTLAMLAAQVELVGVWDLADYRTTENGTGGPPTFPRFVGQHNAPYPRSIYGKGAAAPPPNSPVVTTSGSYVGNGTGQDLTFRTPVHFLFIRPVTGDIGGMKWWPTMGVSHKATQQGGSPWIAIVDEDTTFVPGLGVDLQQQRYRVRLAGNDAQVNAVGVTYHYVAFSDPGARFALCGQMSHLTTQATFDTLLINAGFTPEAAFIHGESPDANGAQSLYFKGLGVAADTILRFASTAQLAAAMTFAAGKLTTQAAFHALNGGISLPFALFRRHDGLNDPGEPGVLALATWLGDGNASRTISLAPTSGKRPIFAVVCASDAGGGFFRDASHLTTHSCKDNGTDSTTGITGGGIDSFSVGVALNANGVTYSAFVLIGDATAGNGGWGADGEFIPVEAAPPADGPFPTPPDPSVINPPAPAPTPLVGEPDLDEITTLSNTATSIGGLVGGQKCEVYTRHVVNMALSRIGVSKRVANVATELSQEAVLARSHILEDTNQVLRDFSWPFARRYANLVLVAGTATVPVNADWQYSYRAPNAMMKARRVANQNQIQRRYDPNPPRFDVGADDSGPLIYSNEVATTAQPLVLEYTVRSLCPALYGDALFRDALAWKYAFSLAPVLSKDTKKQDYCHAQYQLAISKASAGAAQEQQQPRPGDADWINDREFGPNAQPTSWPWGER